MNMFDNSRIKDKIYRDTPSSLTSEKRIKHPIKSNSIAEYIRHTTASLSDEENDLRTKKLEGAIRTGHFDPQEFLHVGSEETAETGKRGHTLGRGQRHMAQRNNVKTKIGSDGTRMVTTTNSHSQTKAFLSEVESGLSPVEKQEHLSSFYTEKKSKTSNPTSPRFDLVASSTGKLPKLKNGRHGEQRTTNMGGSHKRISKANDGSKSMANLSADQEELRYRAGLANSVLSSDKRHLMSLSKNSRDVSFRKDAETKVFKSRFGTGPKPDKIDTNYDQLMNMLGIQDPNRSNLPARDLGQLKREVLGNHPEDSRRAYKAHSTKSVDDSSKVLAIQRSNASYSDREEQQLREIMDRFTVPVAAADKPYNKKPKQFQSASAVVGQNNDLDHKIRSLLEMDQGPPSGRREVELLAQWLNFMLSKVSEESHSANEIFQSGQVVYTACFKELIRQVSVECFERGDLMKKIWQAYLELFEQLLDTSRVERDMIEKNYTDQIKTMKTSHQKQIETEKERASQIRHELDVIRDRAKRLEDLIKVKVQREKMNLDRIRGLERDNRSKTIVVERGRNFASEFRDRLDVFIKEFEEIPLKKKREILQEMLHRCEVFEEKEDVHRQKQQARAAAEAEKRMAEEDEDEELFQESGTDMTGFATFLARQNPDTVEKLMAEPQSEGYDIEVQTSFTAEDLAALLAQAQHQAEALAAGNENQEEAPTKAGDSKKKKKKRAKKPRGTKSKPTAEVGEGSTAAADTTEIADSELNVSVLNEDSNLQDSTQNISKADLSQSTIQLNDGEDNDHADDSQLKTGSIKADIDATDADKKSVTSQQEGDLDVEEKTAKNKDDDSQEDEKEQESSAEESGGGDDENSGSDDGEDGEEEAETGSHGVEAGDDGDQKQVEDDEEETDAKKEEDNDGEKVGVTARFRSPRKIVKAGENAGSEADSGEEDVDQEGSELEDEGLDTDGSLADSPDQKKSKKLSRSKKQKSRTDLSMGEIKETTERDEDDPKSGRRSSRKTPGRRRGDPKAVSFKEQGARDTSQEDNSAPGSRSSSVKKSRGKRHSLSPSIDNVLADFQRVEKLLEESGSQDANALLKENLRELRHTLTRNFRQNTLLSHGETSTLGDDDDNSFVSNLEEDSDGVLEEGKGNLRGRKSSSGTPGQSRRSSMGSGGGPRLPATKARKAATHRFAAYRSQGTRKETSSLFNDYDSTDSEGESGSRSGSRAHSRGHKSGEPMDFITLRQKALEGKDHPCYPVVIRVLKAPLKKLKKYGISKKSMYKLIANFYTSRIQFMKATKDDMQNQEMPPYVYDTFFNKYGIKKVAEEKFTQILAGCLFLRDNPRIELFGRMMGLFDPLELDEVNFILRGIKYMATLNVGIEHNNTEASDKYFMPAVRAYEFTKGYFEKQLSNEEMVVVKRTLDSIRIEDPFKRNKSGLMDVDIMFSRLLRFYNEIKEKARNIIQDVFNAVDTDHQGVLSQVEFGLLFRCLEPTMSYSKVETLFNDYSQTIKVVATEEDAEESFTESVINFDVFTTLCFENDLFSKENQTSFLGIKNESSLRTYISDLTQSWGKKKERFVRIFQNSRIKFDPVQRLILIALMKSISKSLRRVTRSQNLRVVWMSFRILEEDLKQPFINSIIDQMVPNRLSKMEELMRFHRQQTAGPTTELTVATTSANETETKQTIESFKKALHLN